MTAFATAANLAGRLGVATPTGTTLAQWNAALDDASEFWRAVIGWQVYPSATVSVVLIGDGSKWLTLPGLPSAVTSVTGDYAPSTYTVIDGSLYSESRWYGQLTVVYDVGYDTAPADLVAYTCVVASQVLAVTNDLGSLSATGVASIGIDDYRKSWSQGESSGLDVPDRTIELMRSRYGSGAAVTGMRS